MPGRLTRRLIDDTLADLDTNQLTRVFAIARRRAAKASRAAHQALKAEAPLATDGSLEGRPGVKSTVELAMMGAMLPVEVEDAISRIRQRYIQTDGVAHTLLSALAGPGGGDVNGHTVIVEEARVEDE